MATGSTFTVVEELLARDLLVRDGVDGDLFERDAYKNLIYFNHLDKGGHFAAWEEPALFVQEVRAAFKTLR